MIKRYFSFFCFVLISFLMLLCFTSCHGADESVAFKVPDEFDTNKQYEIVFWAKNENNSTQRGVYEDAIAGFEAIYPNVKVTIKLIMPSSVCLAKKNHQFENIIINC